MVEEQMLLHKQVVATTGGCGCELGTKSPESMSMSVKADAARSKFLHKCLVINYVVRRAMKVLTIFTSRRLGRPST